MYALSERYAKWTDYPDYVDIASAEHTFDSLAVAAPQTLDLGGLEQAKHVQVDFVSSTFFKVTGLPITMGRPFIEQEDVWHGPLVAVLNERFWRRHFQPDPAIVGKSITLSGWTFQVIGVAPLRSTIGDPRSLMRMYR